MSLSLFNLLYYSYTIQQNLPSIKKKNVGLLHRDPLEIKQINKIQMSNSLPTLLKYDQYISKGKKTTSVKEQYAILENIRLNSVLRRITLSNQIKIKRLNQTNREVLREKLKVLDVIHEDIIV